MLNHKDEYAAAFEAVRRADSGALTAHWRAAEVLAKYNESGREIARALGLPLATVQRHVLIGKMLPTLVDLRRVLIGHPEIQCWTHLLAWAVRRRDEARGREQGGLDLAVPEAVIKALADQGCDAREVMTRFWQNASPVLLITVAYPDRLHVA